MVPILTGSAAIGAGFQPTSPVRETTTEEPIADRICACLKAQNLPVVTEYPPDMLAEAAGADKKRSGDEITIIVPRKIGRCALEKIPVGGLLFTIRAGWREN